MKTEKKSIFLLLWFAVVATDLVALTVLKLATNRGVSSSTSK